MSLKEDAVAGSTSAVAVAGVRAPLGGRIKRVVPMTKKKKVQKELQLPIKEAKFSAFLKEFADDAKPVDVIGQLSQNAKQSDDLDGDGVATYGLETDEGDIVKVLVAREQAKDFEKALADEMQDATDNSQQDIAELLFNLNDRFHIVDVVWPTIQEDEEQGAGDPNAQQDPNAAPGAPGMDQNDPSADPNADPMATDPNADPMADPMGGPDDMDAGGSDGVQSALDQIIDFLKSDAEARKAEADAKAAEAHAREAEAAGKAAETKLAGEEQIMNAEDYFKQKKDADKEAGRLKMLAKYRQETKSGGSSDIGGDDDFGGGAGAGAGAQEDEEQTTRMRKTLLRILRGGH